MCAAIVGRTDFRKEAFGAARILGSAELSSYFPQDYVYHPGELWPELSRPPDHDIITVLFARKTESPKDATNLDIDGQVKEVEIAHGNVEELHEKRGRHGGYLDPDTLEFE